MIKWKQAFQSLWMIQQQQEQQKTSGKQYRTVEEWRLKKKDTWIKEN